MKIEEMWKRGYSIYMKKKINQVYQYEKDNMERRIYIR